MAGYDTSSAFLLFLMMIAEAEEYQLDDHQEDQGSDHSNTVDEDVSVYERSLGGEYQGNNQGPDLRDIVDESFPLYERVSEASTEETGAPSDLCTGLLDPVPATSRRQPIYTKPRLSPKEYAASHKMTSKRRTLDRSRDRFEKQVLMNGAQGTTGKESTTTVIGSSVVHKEYDLGHSDEGN